MSDAKKLTKEEAVCLLYQLPRADFRESYKNPTLASARRKLREMAGYR